MVSFLDIFSWDGLGPSQEACNAQKRLKQLPPLFINRKPSLKKLVCVLIEGGLIKSKERQETELMQQ